MTLTNELIWAMLCAYDRRLAGYPKIGSLFEEAVWLLTHGCIGNWSPR